MTSYFPFNINDYVAVQLTDHGRAVHRANFDALGIPPEVLQYRPPTEDQHGWSRWQMWSLMQEFGAHISMGSPSPFETNIRIERQ